MIWTTSLRFLVVRACRHRSKKSVLLEIFESIVSSERLEALFEPQSIDGGTPIIPLQELWKPKAPFPGYEAIDRICTAARPDHAKYTEICENLANRKLHILRKLASDAADKEGTVPVRRGRIVIFCQGRRAGKTSTVKALMGEPYDGACQSTAGTEVNDVSIKDLGAEVFEVDVDVEEDGMANPWKKGKRDGNRTDRALVGYILLSKGGKFDWPAEGEERKVPKTSQPNLRKPLPVI